MDRVVYLESRYIQSDDGDDNVEAIGVFSDAEKMRTFVTENPVWLGSKYCAFWITMDRPDETWMEILFQ